MSTVENSRSVKVVKALGEFTSYVLGLGFFKIFLGFVLHDLDILNLGVNVLSIGEVFLIAWLFLLLKHVEKLWQIITIIVFTITNYVFFVTTFTLINLDLFMYMVITLSLINFTTFIVIKYIVPIYKTVTYARFRKYIK